MYEVPHGKPKPPRRKPGLSVRDWLVLLIITLFIGLLIYGYILQSRFIAY